MRTTSTSIIKLLYVALFALGGILAGCGKSNNTTMPVNNTGSYAASVSINNFAFSPATVHIFAGGSVTWTNKDGVDHTATDRNGNFDSGHMGTNQTYKFTFMHTGTFTYHCAIHTQMADATVVVSNP